MSHSQIEALFNERLAKDPRDDGILRAVLDFAPVRVHRGALVDRESRGTSANPG